MKPEDWQEIGSLYPELAAALKPQEVGALRRIDFAPATCLFREGESCIGFPLLLEGEVRVSRSGSSGRELELYRLVPGEICLVSSSCLFSGQSLSARGITAGMTRLVLIAPETFRRALEDTGFRDFVFGLFASRLADLTGLIEAIAFQRLDSRLASALLGRGTQVRVTHQVLADELGTVREIITRLLRRFEQDGLVSLSRECVSIVDSAALRMVASRR